MTGLVRQHWPPQVLISDQCDVDMYSTSVQQVTCGENSNRITTSERAEQVAAMGQGAMDQG